MKPTGSEIITSQGTPGSETGTQLGGHGLATHDASRRAEEHPQRAVEWLKRSLPSLRHDQAAREMASAALIGLQPPANSTWVLARIAALLSPYYEKDVPQAVRMMEAEDWAEALSDYPQWAIQNAVRWWKSEHNADRRRRPMEGDIAAACRKEMDAVRAAAFILSQPLAPPPAASLPRPDALTAEERREIAAKAMAEVFKDKKIGASND